LIAGPKPSLENWDHAGKRETEPMFAPNHHHYDLVRKEQAHRRGQAARLRMASDGLETQSAPVTVRAHGRRLAAAAISLALAIGIAGGVAAAANQAPAAGPSVDASPLSGGGGGQTLIR
jgi:hypothetical protein